MAGSRAGVGQDGAGLGGDGAGVGFEDQVVGDRGGLVLDDQGGGEGVDVLVEGDLGLPAGAGEPAQRRVDQGVGGDGGGAGGRGVGGGGGGVVGDAAAGEQGDRGEGEGAGEAGELHGRPPGCGCRFWLTGSASVAGVAAPFAGKLQAGSSANDCLHGRVTARRSREEMGHTEQGLAQGQGTERTARRGPGRISQAADKGRDEDLAGQESPRLALLGSAVVLPLAAAVGGRALFALDACVPLGARHVYREAGEGQDAPNQMPPSCVSRAKRGQRQASAARRTGASDESRNAPGRPVAGRGVGGRGGAGGRGDGRARPRRPRPRSPTARWPGRATRRSWPP